MKIVSILLILFTQFAYCSQFGQYRYANYNAINQQRAYNRALAIKMQRYNKNPLRNIKYPTRDNPYPNIQRTNSYNLTKMQRYSPNYYNRYVR